MTVRCSVALELKWTKKVASSKGAGHPLPEIAVARIPGLPALRLAVTLEVFHVVQRWHRMEEQQSHTTMNAEKESEQVKGTSKGKAVAETERVKQRKKARAEKRRLKCQWVLGMECRWRN